MLVGIVLFLTECSSHHSQADSLQRLVSITPVSGEGGKLGAVFADLQGLAAGLGLGQCKEISVQLHGKADLVLREAVVGA